MFVCVLIFRTLKIDRKRGFFGSFEQLVLQYWNLSQQIFTRGSYNGKTTHPFLEGLSGGWAKRGGDLCVVC